MWDDITTIIFIIILLTFGLLCGLLILSVGILLSPVLIVLVGIIGIVYLIDSIINLVRVCRGKEEKHILNITIEEGEDDDKRGKDI